MKLDAKRFALAAATTMTALSIFNFILIKISCWRMMCGGYGFGRFGRGFGMGRHLVGVCCPWMGLIIGVIISFIGTFLVAWFFAYLYNKLLDRAS